MNATATITFHATTLADFRDAIAIAMEAGVTASPEVRAVAPAKVSRDPAVTRYCALTGQAKFIRLKPNRQPHISDRMDLEARAKTGDAHAVTALREFPDAPADEDAPADTDDENTAATDAPLY